ncbi:MAG: 4-(cytidine 5'-diphospho)-2-C-methyl-D-erythritol kinase [Clostridia bacterium]|nr:4-(cytidine 5'-diphospho)-2-C-methyl-D-erythritol kinase [Clostridia bacterium]
MRIVAKAYAKLNLYLDIIGKRDDGYHDIDSVMQSISLCDIIDAEKSENKSVTIFYNDPEYFRKDDIIFKTCELFFDYSKCDFGVNLRIEKNIPTVAGLGGFSADVAAVLKILNIMSGKNYPDEVMLELCLKLGADMPFCYNGGTARVGSVGDKLLKLSTPKLYFVLLKEGTKPSTGKMYAALDALNLPPSDKMEEMLEGIENGDPKAVFSSVYNSFEKCWNFEEMKSAFSGFSADAVFLSGSGPTVVAGFSEKEMAKKCYETLKSDGRNVFFAETVDSGNLIE